MEVVGFIELFKTDDQHSATRDKLNEPTDARSPTVTDSDDNEEDECDPERFSTIFNLLPADKADEVVVDDTDGDINSVINVLDDVVFRKKDGESYTLRRADAGDRGTEACPVEEGVGETATFADLGDDRVGDKSPPRYGW
jgi:hypothetical protein